VVQVVIVVLKLLFKKWGARSLAVSVDEEVHGTAVNLRLK
jgi:hypothetical protein